MTAKIYDLQVERLRKREKTGWAPDEIEALVARDHDRHDRWHARVVDEADDGAPVDEATRAAELVRGELDLVLEGLADDRDRTR